MKRLWSLLAILLIALPSFAAESSLQFGKPVTWPLEDGQFATVLLLPFPGDATKAQLMVAKPGNPPLLRIHTLLLGEPIPPPPPLPIEALKKLVADAAAKLPAATRADAQAMATIYAEVAKAVPSPIDSTEKLIVATKMAREMALGPARAAAWEPWVKEVGTWLDANKASFPDMAAWKGAWVAIGEALKGVK